MDLIDKSKLLMFGAWSGIYYCLLAVIGWILVAQFLPPHSPSASAEDIAAIFQNNTIKIRIGMVITMFAAFFAMPFAAVISHFLARIEKGAAVLANAALLGGAGTMVLTFYPPIWWLTAAFRPDRPAEIILALNDMSWLQFVGGTSMFYSLPLAISAAAFLDKSPNPVFPRWLGWVNIWIIAVMMPDQLLFFFHNGPFSWAGIFGLWLPFGAFFAWFVVTWYCLRKAILRERAAGEVPFKA